MPVVDLGARLGRRALPLTKRSCIVLVEIRSQQTMFSLGLLVDQVDNILDIPATDVKPASTFGSEIQTNFIESMGRVDDLFVIILAINRVMSNQELATLKEIADTASPRKR